MEKAAFGAGCFWGVEAAFRKMGGVESTAVGYMGGHTDQPTYKAVCTDTTGHAEVVFVEYDPAVVSYAALLDLFWRCHNPTELNRQGPDVGTQYRSAIFTYSAAQQKEAEESRAALTASGKYARPVVTEIAPAATFFIAEDDHQQYLEKRGLASCHLPG
ncbi:MAG: peptide-methionine (S)-S-oxide reductase MsrA [Alphaproteobacteria bacterium]|nr:peptide-methionine (S)-S-oxide reductase MsrA [Alphaproteobacteria bacterium]